MNERADRYDTHVLNAILHWRALARANESQYAPTPDPANTNTRTNPPTNCRRSQHRGIESIRATSHRARAFPRPHIQPTNQPTIHPSTFFSLFSLHSPIRISLQLRLQLSEDEREREEGLSVDSFRKAEEGRERKDSKDEEVPALEERRRKSRHCQCRRRSRRIRVLPAHRSSALTRSSSLPFTTSQAWLAILRNFPVNPACARQHASKSMPQSVLDGRVNKRSTTSSFVLQDASTKRRRINVKGSGGLLVVSRTDSESGTPDHVLGELVVLPGTWKDGGDVGATMNLEVRKNSFTDSVVGGDSCIVHRA